MGAARKETLELEIKALIAEARKNVQSMREEIGQLAKEAQKAAPETKALAEALNRVNGQEMKRAAAEAKLFGDSLGTVKKQQALVREAMIDLVESGLDPASDEVKNLLKQYDRLENQSKDIAKATGDSVENFDQLKTAISQSAAAVALLKVADKALDFGEFALDAADNIRATREEFGIMLQNMEAGAAITDRIQDFNAWTPFDLETTKQGTKLLMGAKVPISDLIQKLTEFGDLSQGNAQRFTSFLSAFSKSSAKGVADMEVLNVYVDQGIQIFDALAEQMGKTAAEIPKMASEGKISFEDLTRAIEDMTSKGGQYYGGMALASQRLSAMEEGLNEAVTSLSASYGEILYPAMVAIVGLLTEMTNTINDSPVVQGILAGALVAVAGYLAAMAIKTVALTVKTWLQYAAQMGLNTALSVTNPLLIAGIIAVGAATAAAVIYASTQAKAAEATNETALATVEFNQNQEIAAKKAAATSKTVQEAAKSIYDYKKSMESFADTKSIEDIDQKLTYLKNAYGGFTNEFGGIEFAEGFVPDKIKELIGDLRALRASVESDPFAAMFDSLKKADDLLKEFDSKIKLAYSTKFELLDEEKLRLQLAAATAYAGTEYQNRMKDINNWYKAERIKIEDEIAKEERDEILKSHELRLKLAKEEWEYRREAARAAIEAGDSGAYADYAGASAMAKASDTDVGKLMAGVDPLTMFIDAILDAAMELENVNKLLNFVGTIVDAMFEIIGPIIDGTAGDFVDILEEIGTILGQTLAPYLGFVSIGLKLLSGILKIALIPLQMFGGAMEWLYNDVILPVGNSMIAFMNTVIELLNQIPGVSIKKIGYLSEIGEEAEEIAREMEKQKELITAMYERQKDAVQDQLNAQLDSLQSQYELGLITRSAYEKQAAKYQAAADSKTADINEEMAAALAAIEENTGATVDKIDIEIDLFEDFFDYLEDLFDDIGGGVGDLWDGITGGVADGWDDLGDATGWWDVGTPSVPHDMRSVVHKGEIIVPKTFSDGLRNGDLTLSGPGSGSGTKTATIITVNIVVEGSVIKKDDLIEEVYDGIADGITVGKFTPLPA